MFRCAEDLASAEARSDAAIFALSDFMLTAEGGDFRGRRLAQPVRAPQRQHETTGFATVRAPIEFLPVVQHKQLLLIDLGLIQCFGLPKVFCRIAGSWQDPL